MTETEPRAIPTISFKEYSEILAHGTYGSAEVVKFCTEKGIPLDSESVEIMVGGNLVRIDTREDDFGTMDADSSLPE